ncbi:histone-fold-containing protein [Wolfiporia cocos MD-104 SS10]|uniref:Histone-fold-containing protein n=1 Tax=Wolfiporia cocos (strain MD-104) TaxID=742152 RepID=A0A2H3JJR0_WOLCO|nr:histone-fold-containing protein [Wolfiporia cocos MD-104 SS10]
MSGLVRSMPFVQPGEPLQDFLRSFWQRQVDAAEQETPDYRHPPLPLARIKKVMKSDPDVKVTPVLFCKACEVFIAEITARAFIIADSNKRRTLSRADIAKALSKSDQFDFLIDIVPREEPIGGANPAARAQAKKVGGSQAKIESGDGQQDSGENDSGGGVAQPVDLEQLQTLLSPPGTENRSM